MGKWMILVVTLLLTATVFPRAAAAKDVEERMNAATSVFNEIMNTPDQGIPQDLLNKAQCVIIIPSMKQAGFMIGGKYGRGVATCRTDTGWSPPDMVTLGGGSFGLQAGGQAVDLVLLVMNKGGEDFLTRDKVTLGADASATAGPVGRHAEAATNATANSQILAWSRSKGVFGGIALNGATLQPDKDANKQLYGKSVSPAEILQGQVQMPATAQPLISAISQRSGTMQGGR